MKKNYFIQKIFAVGATLLLSLTAQAQQLPDSSFEDWSGAAFDGKAQPKYWHFSNVEQLGIKFNLAHQEAGHTGQYSMMVQCTEVGAMGITEAAPGYISLGQPWQCLPSITEIKKATAGTSGGVSWTYRPDSMQVWVKRTGNNTDKEDFHLLYYSWNGTAKGSSYKGKDNSCTSYNATDEESDIRQALDKNECMTTQYANQIAEGWHRARAKYDSWTCITVPIYYLNDDAPTKCNVIFSASNYPNFRANGGLYVGNSLYVDDIKMVYSSKIQKLYIGNKEWKGFDPNSTEEQTYSLGNNPTIPDIYAMRGAGVLTNAHGGSATFNGRKLTSSEISIQKGEIDGAPTVITVKAEDGSSTTTYKIKFISKPSDNARLAGIQVNGDPLAGFNSYVANYDVALPYGTTVAPVVTYTQAEDGQTVQCTQATSTSGKATIKVTAADGKTTFTYMLNFSVALLADNTLKDILIDGTSLPGFKPEYTTYNRVELPLGTTELPRIEAVSAYPAGAQTITHTAPSVIDGGQYQIAVSTPGNPTPKVYKLNFKITASTNTLLKNLQVGNYITNFDPELTTYYVTLPMGTTQLPEITYEKGDKWQTVTVENEGVDGTSRITVTAASGDQRVYKIVFNTLKSEVDWLDNIYLNGVALEGFARDKYVYEYQLPIGTTELPEITFDKGDEFQTVTVKTDGVNGTTRITVVAGNGSTTLYQIKFSVLKANNANLKMIYVDGVALVNFAPTTLEYTVNLPQGTTAVPTITWDKGDEWQTVTYRAATSLTGESKITVRPQEGASQTYVIRFTVNTSANTDLKMIYLDGKPLEGFRADSLHYTITLPVGVGTIPTITFDKVEDVQRVIQLQEGTICTLRVTAENGETKTYTITFHVQKSENAFLKMIYLDGDSLKGFQHDKLSGYTVELEGDRCPIIKVDKEAGQQVTIITPASIGEARITVQPESGAANTYVINFVKSITADVKLKNILINGVALANFSANVFDYDVAYSDSLPQVTYELFSAEQEVTMLRDKENVTLLVRHENLTNVYTLHFHRQFSVDTGLKNILLNGVPLAGFVPSQLTYNIPINTNEVLPIVTYEKNAETQTVVAGALSEYVYSLQVIAETGAKQTYILTFDKVLCTDATLQDILLDGTSIVGFTPTKTDYSISIGEGMTLPTVTYVKRAAQNVLLAQTSDHQQQVLVVAENGTQMTYTIDYVFHQIGKDNALLKDILVDGISLEGFESTKYQYIDSLAWRTKVVPVINPISIVSGQTITVAYSAINGVTKIHVVAPDGVTTADYMIEFPVVKSSNTLLESVLCEEEFEFDPQITDYEITMPYGKNYAPLLRYEKQEAEQAVRYIATPMGDTTKIIVKAENGDERTYRFFFHPTLSTAPNRLRGILVNGIEIDTTINKWQVIDDEHIEMVVDMPYGTNTFNVACKINYVEQTYFIQPGGTLRPTVITLKANRADEKDVIYTIRPNIDKQNPAHLTGISVNGTPLADFDKNRYSYIVELDNSTTIPDVKVTCPAGVIDRSSVPTFKDWKSQVICGTDTVEYSIVFYYPNEKIPNGEFTDWKTTKYNNQKMPVGWNVIADNVKPVVNILFDIDVPEIGEEVSQFETDKVYLHTKYASALGGMVPGFITLGKVSGSLSVAGSSNFEVNGTIPFHNSPDLLQVRYKQESISTNNRIVYELSGSKGSTILEYKDVKTVPDYIVRDIDLKSANDAVGIPMSMNIILNSYKTESGTINADGAKMYVDWVRFSYNSKLKSIVIGDEEPLLPKADNTFAYSFAYPEANTQPEISFVGEVNDQAQKVEWSNEVFEGDSARRTATITNYAEDGTSTNYTFVVSRPLSQLNTLNGIDVKGVALVGFNKDILDYTYPLQAADKIPNIVVAPATDQQTITMVFADDKMTITVTPEYGAAKVYTITFVRTKSNDTTLKALNVEGITFNPATREYTISAEVLPAITFEKSHAAQKVDVQDGVITVTAEDGTVGKYEIVLTPILKTTSGLLARLQVDGNDLQGFSSTIFEYEYPQSTTTSFVRKDECDSVVQVISSTGISWTVYGSETTNTYRIIHPTILSADVNLATISVNGETMLDFLPVQSDYEIKTDSTITISLKIKKGQECKISYDEGEYIIEVIAENNTKRAEPYRLKIVPDLSDIATLGMIYLDGMPLENFKAETLKYVITLPCDNPKTREPQMPSITYDLGQRSQQVQVDMATTFGATSYITVTSETGAVVTMYELTINSELSHNATLNSILIDGVEVEGFSPNRYWYSAQIMSDIVDVRYSSEDAFQTVVEKRTETGEYTIEVTAQDGITKCIYSIKLWQQRPSNNAYLYDVLLDGKKFSEYDTEAQDFTAKQLYYNIRIHETATQLPDLYVALQEDGQQWTRLSGKDVDTIRVTAPDGITINDYVLNFLRAKSSNADLSMIYLDGIALEGFDPIQTNYTIKLPIGVTVLPEVLVAKAESVQTYTQSQEGNTISYVVTAEDGTQKVYTLNFVFVLSDADTLTMLYEDGVAMADFGPQTFYYAKTLPIGVRTFPEVSYDAADQWQTITIDTIATAMQTTYQLNVQAQSGKKNVYTIVYTLQQSAVDTLKMIYLDNKELEGFEAIRTDYTIILPIEASIPAISWLEGDNYQTVDTVTMGNTTKLTVRAENGVTRTYSLTFMKALSDNATLSMISLAGKDITNFDSEVFNYDIALPYGTASIPAISFTKAEDAQNVSIVLNEWIAQIIVVAQDGVTTQTYTLNFTVNRSANAYLQMIRLDGKMLQEFEPQQTEYDIMLPLGTETLPVVTWQTADDQQTVSTDTISATSLMITVTSGNKETTTEYVLRFQFEKSSVNTLSDLAVAGTTLKGFKPEVNEYYITFAPNTLESELYTIEDITFTLTDSTATATALAQDAYTLMVLVEAANGASNAYIIHQEISLPNNALLADLQIDGITVEGFDPEVFEYEYLLLDGGIMPTITATAEDSTAEVSVTMGNVGDTTYVYCTAQDGTEYVYTVFVHYTELRTTEMATDQDVILKHIPGSNQFIAATTRQGVQIMILNMNGQKMQLHKVPMCNPNSVNVAIDANGNELLTDVDVHSEGMIITIDDFNTPLFYIFLQNDSRRVATGKIMLAR